MRVDIESFFKTKLGIERHITYMVGYSTLSCYFTENIIKNYFQTSCKSISDYRYYSVNEVVKLTYNNKLNIRFSEQNKPLKIDYELNERMETKRDFKMNYIDNVFHNLKTLLDSETNQQ